MVFVLPSHHIEWTLHVTIDHQRSSSSFSGGCETACGGVTGINRVEIAVTQTNITTKCNKMQNVSRTGKCTKNAQKSICSFVPSLWVGGWMGAWGTWRMRRPPQQVLAAWHCEILQKYDIMIRLACVPRLDAPVPSMGQRRDGAAPLPFRGIVRVLLQGTLDVVQQKDHHIVVRQCYVLNACARLAGPDLSNAAHIGQLGSLGGGGDSEGLGVILRGLMSY